jgi:succinate dehydrogenase / fumarate reductase cytochrome b subunit
MIPFLRSTLAAKLGMAVTGLLLTGFVIGHLSGNFLIFAGQDAINDYAEFLKKNVGLLWSARIGLLVVFAVHILLAIRVRNGNRSARPTRYAYEDTVQASAASRTMILSGLVILAYVVFHLMHFTFGWIDPETYHLIEKTADGHERHDVYNMMVAEFSSVPIVCVYAIGMVLLGLHLSHALKSMLQTFGLRSPTWAPRVEWVMTLIGWLLAAAYTSIPVAVLLGIVQPTAANAS